MRTTNEDIKIVSAKNQLRLFGFEDYFNSFIKLFEKNIIIGNNIIPIGWNNAPHTKSLFVLTKYANPHKITNETPE